MGPRRRLPPPGRADTGPGRGRKSDLTSIKPAIYPPKRPQARGRTWGLPPPAAAYLGPGSGPGLVPAPAPAKHSGGVPAPAPAKHSGGQQVVYSSIPLAKLSFRAARAGGWCGTTFHEPRCRARRPPPARGPGAGAGPGPRYAPGTGPERGRTRQLTRINRVLRAQNGPRYAAVPGAYLGPGAGAGTRPQVRGRHGPRKKQNQAINEDKPRN